MKPTRVPRRKRAQPAQDELHHRDMVQHRAPGNNVGAVQPGSETGHVRLDRLEARGPAAASAVCAWASRLALASTPTSTPPAPRRRNAAG